MPHIFVHFLFPCHACHIRHNSRSWHLLWLRCYSFTNGNYLSLAHLLIVLLYQLYFLPKRIRSIGWCYHLVACRQTSARVWECFQIFCGDWQARFRFTLCCLGWRSKQCWVSFARIMASFALEAWRRLATAVSSFPASGSYRRHSLLSHLNGKRFTAWEGGKVFIDVLACLESLFVGL